MLVEIINWEKYNPRKDIKHSSWCRLENNFLTHPAFFSLTNDQKVLWIGLICAASQSQKSVIEVDASMFSLLLKVPESLVVETISLFKERGLLTLPRRNVRVTSRRPTNGRTDERTDGESESSPYRLAELWNKHSDPKQPKVDLTRFGSHSERWKAATARLAKEPDLTYWQTVIERIAKSDFCRGANERAWYADFDFLTRVETHTRAMEGKYDNRKAATAKPKQQTPIFDPASEGLS